MKSETVPWPGERLRVLVSRWLDSVGRVLEETVPAILIGCIALGLFVNVVGRYVFERPVTGASELSIAAVIWLVFLGSAGATRRSLHIAIDVLVRRLPARAQASVALVIELGVVVTMTVLAVWGWELTAGTQRALPLTGISAQYVWVAIPVGSALMAVRNLRWIVHAAKGVISGIYERPQASFTDAFPPGG